MKRIIIICEGQTEMEFCNSLLVPYFLKKGYQLHCPLIKKSGGGIVAWQVLKKQILNHLNSDKDSFVTTLIDYYGILQKHIYPGWEESKNVVDRSERMSLLERSMKSELPDNLRYRLIPYIQLHEFEGLLFNNLQSFETLFSSGEILQPNELKNIFNEYPNPEMINDSSITAPSKRLGNIIDGYNKIVYGTLLAEEIGLERIREKSPRFNHWIEMLEKL